MYKRQTYTSVIAWPAVLNTKFEVPELIGCPFLSKVKLFDANVPLVSITVTSSPTAGEEGRSISIGLAVVFAKICAPATAAYGLLESVIVA